MQVEIVEAPKTMTRAEIRKRYKKGTGKAAKRAENRKYQIKKQDTRPFVAWDGEGVNRPDGSHDYVMLANSSGARVENVDKIPTEIIFEFILDNIDAKAINVIYGASYDWNMWLSDLPETYLRQLYKKGVVQWRGYSISWRRGKTFAIRYGKRRALFYDVVSFFQCSFVKACDSYLGDRFIDREMIAQNKLLRSDFRTEDLQEIARYNEAELINLGNLMQELRSRLHRVGLKPSRWDGPGAVAVALMKRENIKEHLEIQSEEIQQAARFAYFGGRFEVIKCGNVTEKAYEYDLNSAYPYALTQVPSLAGGSWELVKECDDLFAIYHLEYVGKTAPTLPQPLPCRYENGSVAYPLEVTGWYWGPEYHAAKKYCEQWGGELRVIEVWRFNPAADHKPFGFIKPLYEERRLLKKNGDGAHMGIKLGLNSLYGKLAQQVGWRTDENGEPILPPYHQLEWAGFVTSVCRAKVLEACIPVINKVISWETDAVFCEIPLPVQIGDDLGEWEQTTFTRLCYLQSGMYFAETIDGEVINKTRGVDKAKVDSDKTKGADKEEKNKRGNVDYEDVVKALSEGREKVPAKLTRFIGLGLALQSQFHKWRRWIASDKELSLVPDGKRSHFTCSKCEANTFTMNVWHETILAIWAVKTHSLEYEIEWKNPGKMSEVLSALRSGHYEGSLYDD